MMGLTEWALLRPGAVLGVSGNLSRADLSRPGGQGGCMPQNSGTFALQSTCQASSSASSTGTAHMTKSTKRRAKKKNKKKASGS